MITLLLLALLRPSLSAPVATLEDAPAALLGRNAADHMYTRQKQDIVRSCLFTVFSCVWVAVHPNLPDAKESGWARFRRQLVTMAYAIIAPELLTMWALRQRYAAARIKREYNEKYHTNVLDARHSGFGRCIHTIKEWFHSPEDDEPRPWTLAHGFFIQAGGFMFFQDGKPAFVLTFDKLKELIGKDIIDLPSISEEAIWDRSKGDILTKAIVVFQTTWFIVQCLVRWALGRTVTELEVITFAFCVINIFTYSLWWQKPQNVQTAIAISKKSGAPDVPIEQQTHRGTWLQRKIDENPGGAEGFLGWMMLISFLVPLKLLRGLFSPLAKMAIDCQVPKGALRVPMFYADFDLIKEYHVILPALTLSVIFGAIHLIPWATGLPPSTETTLWIISAIIITAEPLPVTIGTGLTKLTKGRRGGEAVRMVIDALAMSLGSIGFIFMPIYVLARITLVILAFATLRNLPEEALTDIAWSSYFPHFM